MNPQSVRIAAQLTYSSADATGGPGGWQVLQRTGDLDDSLLSALTRRMSTSLEPTFAMPEYRVPELPKRLLVTSVSEDDPRIAAWHSVPAGRDGSGRPGNVFTHCLLLDDTVGWPARLWRSSDWLAPFGTREVGAANLPSGSEISPGITPAEIAEFLFDPSQWRLGVLAVVLDGLSAAMTGGKPIALIVDDSETAALWIAASGLATDARTARGIHFSSYERAREVTQWRRLGIHLAGVPRADASLLEAESSVVVIDTNEPVTLGFWHGNPHQTSRGDAVPATPWSSLLLARWSSPEDILDFIGQAEQIRLQLPDPVWEPAWPLALTSFSSAEPISAAAEVLARSTPPEVQRRPEYYESVAAALHFLMGQDLSAAWTAMQGIISAGSDLMAPLAAGVFSANAVNDPEWLATHQIPIEVLSGLRPNLTAELKTKVISGLRQQGATAEVTLASATAALKSIDLLAQLDWISGEIEGQLIRNIDRVAEFACRCGDELDPLVKATGTTARRMLRDAVEVHRFGSLSDQLLEELGFTSEDYLLSDRPIVEGLVTPLAANAAQLVLERGGLDSPLISQAQYLQLRHQLEGRAAAASLEPPIRLGITQLTDLVNEFGKRIDISIIVSVYLRYRKDPGLSELRKAVETHHAEAVQTINAVEDLAAPVNTFLSIDDYLFRVDRLDQVLRADPNLINRLPPQAIALSQAVRVAQVLFYKDSGTTQFAQAAPPPLPAGQIDALAKVITNTPEKGLANIALELVAWGATGSPIRRSLGFPTWVDRLGPADFPLPEQILAAVLRAAAPQLDTDRLANLAERLVKQDPALAKALTKFLTRWAQDHVIDTPRGPAGWLKQTRKKRSEEA